MSIHRTHPFLVWLTLTLAGVTALLGAFWCGLQGSMLFMLLGVISIAVLAVRDNFSHSDRQHRRCEQLRQRADDMRLEFRETAAFNPLGWDESFELTRHAFGCQSVVDESLLLGPYISLAMPKSRHVFLRSEKEFKLALFDYEFSDDDVTYNQATAAISAPGLQQAYFALHPANAWHRLSDGLRKSSLIHGNHRLVTKAAISASDTAAIAESLDAHATLEVGHGYLLLYRGNRRPLQPGDVETRLAEVMGVYELVSQILSGTA